MNRSQTQHGWRRWGAIIACGVAVLAGCRPSVSSLPPATVLPTASPLPAPVAAATAVPVTAQPRRSSTTTPTVRFEHLSLEQGLSQSSVLCIIQDSQGLIWFGTQDGLNKYDGYEITVYKPKPNDPTSLSHNLIWTLLEDRSGALWIGTDGGGLDRFDREIGTFTHYRMIPGDPYSLSSDFVWSLYEDQQGVLWVGTGDGLNKFDRERNRFIRYRHDSGNSERLGEDVIWTIYEDKAGTLWLGTDTDGLNRFDRETGRFTSYRNDPADPTTLSLNAVRAIYEDQEGTLWVGTDGGGLNRFDRTTERFARYQHDPNAPYSLSHNTIRAIYEDREGLLWIGTFGGGLELMDKKQGSFTHYRHSPGNPNSLSNDFVWSIHQDRTGGLWVGTFGGGVNHFNRLVVPFAHYQFNPEDSNSLSSNLVSAIYEDREGWLWIGTNGGGLNRLNRSNGQFTHYVHSPQDPGSLSDNTVTALRQDRNGVLWIGTEHGGLDRLDRGVRMLRHYPAIGAISALYEDRRGVLWVGTNGNGLAQFNRLTEQVTFFRNEPANPYSLSSNYVTAIMEDQAGTLWIGTKRGLNWLDRRTGRFYCYLASANNQRGLSSNYVLSIHEGQDGGLWIGTSGGGLNRLDREQETFTHYREADGLPNDVVYGILEDWQGNLWLSTNRGLSKFNKQTETFVNYDVSDGLQGNEFSPGAFMQSADGEMFFGGVNGFNAFFPGQVQELATTLPVVLTALTQNGIPLYPRQAAETIHTLTLPWSANSFEFEFAALSYLQPEKNQYAYMLENFDQNWNYIGTRHFGQYTNLPGGTYTLRLRGSGDGKTWNEGTPLTVTVVPPFWMTWWFSGLVTLALAGALFGGYRLRVRTIQTRSRALEDQVALRTIELSQANTRLAQEIAERQRAEEALAQQAAQVAVTAERNRLARDLHDSVTQALYGMTLYAEAAARLLSGGETEPAAEHLRDLRDTAQEALREMRLLIFELRPSTLEEEGLVAALEARLEAVESRVGLKIHFVPQVAERLPAELEIGLYRIAQEALNNVLKHAQARQITVTLGREHNRVRMEIADDGVGFDPELTRACGGWGLRGMEERATQLGGQLIINSRPGAGTCIQVEVPL